MYASSNIQGKPLRTYKRLLSRQPIPFVGRERHFLEMNDFLNETFNNQGCCLIVRGESGVGKTRFVEKFLDVIDTSDVLVLKTRVFDSDKQHVEPFRRIIDQCLRTFDYKPNIITNLISSDIAPQLFKYLPQLRPLFPSEVGTPSSSGRELFLAINHGFFKSGLLMFGNCLDCIKAGGFICFY